MPCIHVYTEWAYKNRQILKFCQQRKRKTKKKTQKLKYQSKPWVCNQQWQQVQNSKSWHQNSKSTLLWCARTERLRVRRQQKIACLYFNNIHITFLWAKRFIWQPVIQASWWKACYIANNSVDIGDDTNIHQKIPQQINSSKRRPREEKKKKPTKTPNFASDNVVLETLWAICICTCRIFFFARSEHWINDKKIFLFFTINGCHHSTLEYFLFLLFVSFCHLLSMVRYTHINSISD